eukprot:scaffold22701_cov123-Cylindrotheca_fusiformis.AAC.20
MIELCVDCGTRNAGCAADDRTLKNQAMSINFLKWRNRSTVMFLVLLLRTMAFVDGSFIGSSHQYGSTDHPQAMRAKCDLLREWPTAMPMCSRRKIGHLSARPQDNLIAGVSEIGLGFSLGVLWSEYSIIMTGCGPLNFSDTLERICYQGVIVLAGTALFNRIVTGNGLDTSANEFFGPLEDFTLFQVRWAEYAASLAAVGAFAALGFQYSRDANMDGLSGIDVAMCRALRDL